MDEFRRETRLNLESLEHMSIRGFAGVGVKLDETNEGLAELRERLDELGQTIAAIGVTDQRETVVAWDRATGFWSA